MKIAIDVSQIVYGTGVSNYTASLVESLLKIDHKNEYIMFASAFRQRRKLKEFQEKLKDHNNIQFKILPYPPTVIEIAFNRFRYPPIEKIIGEVDVFHSSDWTQPKAIGAKMVTTVHDMVVFLFEKSIHPKIVATQKRRLALVKNEADTIICDSETTKDDLVKFLGVDEGKARVIYLAASEEFKPQDEDKTKEVLEKYKIKKPYILSVATQEPRKNIQKLLDVFEKIVAERPQLHLVLTGKYGWGPGFHSAQNVVWTGFVSQEDLVALYSGCRLFAYPSLYEGFGLPILEAMACGAPVVTSNNSSMAEIAKDAAILVDPRSDGQVKKAVDFVLGLNLENYQRIVRASLDRARRYSWTKTARETLKVYKEVAES
ncbi:MAG: glycosyltransferase family 1 protein [Patescibacteria group bacterium]